MNNGEYTIKVLPKDEWDNSDMLRVRVELYIKGKKKIYRGWINKIEGEQ